MRLARPEDAPAISALMRASILELFPRYHDERQTASAAEHIGELDTALIEDGTYYVHDEGGEMVACGGWSRRDKLFMGACELAAHTASPWSARSGSSAGPSAGRAGSSPRTRRRSASAGRAPRRAGSRRC